MKAAEGICPDFPEWPKRWMGVEEDLSYAQAVLEAMRPFVEHLISSGLLERTIRRHMDNLWLLGGEIIRDVSMNEEYGEISPSEKLRDSVGLHGGPYCRHLNSEGEMRSFATTCRLLHVFLEKGERSPLGSPSHPSE
jgi:hypothetical protein